MSLVLQSPYPKGGGGGGAPTSYRHFRLLIAANNGDGNYTGTNTLELRESAGGADAVQGSGGSASAGDTLGGYPASNAFDGDTGTGWIVDYSPPEWIAWDFGSGNERAIVEYVVGAYPSSNNTNARSPSDWTLQGSNDGATWDDLHTVTGEAGWNLGETRVFSV